MKTSTTQETWNEEPTVLNWTHDPLEDDRFSFRSQRMVEWFDDLSMDANEESGYEPRYDFEDEEFFTSQKPSDKYSLSEKREGSDELTFPEEDIISFESMVPAITFRRGSLVSANLEPIKHPKKNWKRSTTLKKPNYRKRCEDLKLKRFSPAQLQHILNSPPKLDTVLKKARK